MELVSALTRQVGTLEEKEAGSSSLYSGKGSGTPRPVAPASAKTSSCEVPRRRTEWLQELQVAAPGAGLRVEDSQDS